MLEFFVLLNQLMHSHRTHASLLTGRFCFFFLQFTFGGRVVEIRITWWRFSIEESLATSGCNIVLFVEGTVTVPSKKMSTRSSQFSSNASVFFIFQSVPVFIFANQAGLDMLETTLVALQDITLDKIFDESGRKALCSDFTKLMQQVSINCTVLVSTRL